MIKQKKREKKKNKKIKEAKQKGSNKECKTSEWRKRKGKEGEAVTDMTNSGVRIPEAYRGSGDSWGRVPEGGAPEGRKVDADGVGGGLGCVGGDG